MPQKDFTQKYAANSAARYGREVVATLTVCVLLLLLSGTSLAKTQQSDAGDPFAKRTAPSKEDSDPFANVPEQKAAPVVESDPFGFVPERKEEAPAATSESSPTISQPEETTAPVAQSPAPTSNLDRADGSTSKEPLVQARKVGQSQDPDWLNYWPYALGAIILLPLLFWLIKNRDGGGRDVEEIKRGTFKKSTRFQNGEKQRRNPEEFISELVAPENKPMGPADQPEELPNKFDFDQPEETQSDVIEVDVFKVEEVAEPIEQSALALDESANAIVRPPDQSDLDFDDDEDFLDFSLDDSQPDDSQPDDSQPDDSQPDDSQPDDSQIELELGSDTDIPVMESKAVDVGTDLDVDRDADSAEFSFDDLDDEASPSNEPNEESDNTRLSETVTGALAAGGVAAGLGAMLSSTPDETSETRAVEENLQREIKENERLRAEIAQLSDNSRKSESAINQHQQELDALKKDLEEARGGRQNDIDALNEEIAKLKSDYADLTASAETAQTDKEALESKAIAHATSLAEVESQLQAKDSEIEKLKASLSESEAAVLKTADESKEKFNAELQEVLAAKQASAVELQAKLDEAELAADRQLQTIESLEKQVSTLAEERDATAASAAETSNETASDAIDVSELESKLEEEVKLRKETQEMLVEAEDQRTAVAVALRDLRKQINSQANEPQDDSTTKELEAKTETIEKLESDLSESQKEAEQLRKEMAKVKAQVAQENSIAKELQQKLTKFEETVAETTTENDQWASKIDAIETELDRKKKVAEKLESEITELNVQLSDKNSAISDLEAQLEIDAAEKESLAAKLETATAQLSNADDARLKYESQLSELSGALEAKTAELTHQQAQKNELESKVGRLSYAHLEEALANVAQFGSEREALNLQLNEYRDSLSELPALREKLQSRDAALEVLSRDNNLLQQRIQENETLVEKLANKTRSLEEEQSANASLKIENAKLAEKVQGLEQRLALLSQANDSGQQLSQKLGGLEKKLESALAEAESRNIEVQRLSQSAATPLPPSMPAIPMELGKILEHLQVQNEQIGQLVNEQARATTEIAELKELQRASIKPPRSRAAKIPEGHDDLSKIKGVGAQFRQKLYDLGIRSFGQIASWSDADVDDFSDRLGCSRKRIEQEDWIGQSKKLL